MPARRVYRPESENYIVSWWLTHTVSAVIQSADYTSYFIIICTTHCLFSLLDHSATVWRPGAHVLITIILLYRDGVVRRALEAQRPDWLAARGLIFSSRDIRVFREKKAKHSTPTPVTSLYHATTARRWFFSQHYLRHNISNHYNIIFV